MSVMECDNAPLLGAAVLAAVGAGIFDKVGGGEGGEGEEAGKGKREEMKGENGVDEGVVGMGKEEEEKSENKFIFSEILQKKVENGVKAMVRIKRKINPDKIKTKKYERLFLLYEKATESVRSLSHGLVEEAGRGLDFGSDSKNIDEGEILTTTLSPSPSPSSPSPSPTSSPSSSPSLSPSSISPPSLSPPSSSPSPPHSPSPSHTHILPSGRIALIVPSILSADFACLAEESNACHLAGNTLNTDFLLE